MTEYVLKHVDEDIYATRWIIFNGVVALAFSEIEDAKKFPSETAAQNFVAMTPYGETYSAKQYEEELTRLKSIIPVEDDDLNDIANDLNSLADDDIPSEEDLLSLATDDIDDQMFPVDISNMISDNSSSINDKSFNIPDDEIIPEIPDEELNLKDFENFEKI